MLIAQIAVMLVWLGAVVYFSYVSGQNRAGDVAFCVFFFGAILFAILYFAGAFSEVLP